MFSLTCKRATALISVALDGQLPLHLRLLLRLHLRACAACLRFSQQLLLLRQLVRQRTRTAPTMATTATLTPAARTRLKRALCAEASLTTDGDTCKAGTPPRDQ